MPTDKEYADLKSDPRLSVLNPPCHYCEHLTGIGRGESDTDPLALTGWTCKAFPDEIPRYVLRRKIPHTKPFPGQHGTKVFESKSFEFFNGPDQITFEGEWGNLPPESDDVDG